MSEPVLLVEKNGGVATLTLNRAQAMNALSRALVHALADNFEELSNDPETGVVIITGAGRAFCAGLDLKEISSGVPLDDSPGGLGINRLIRLMAGFDRPIIGAINGPAITGGFELALACDVLVASAEGRFADTHARVGILPGWGLSQKLPRLIGVVRAKALSFTGNYLSPEQAEAWGLVYRTVPPDDLMPVCRALAKDMLSCVPEALREYKRILDLGFGLPLAQALEMESQNCMAKAKSLKADDVAARRKEVQKRGREQKDG